MDSTLIAGAVGGAIGGAVGAIFTGGSSKWLDDRRGRQRLSGALGTVGAEVDENRRRLAGGGNAAQMLTLHDWVTNKPTISEQLQPRNEKLWEDMVRAYGRIHDVRNGAYDSAPTAGQLGQLKQDLDRQRLELKRPIRAKLTHLRPGS